MRGETGQAAVILSVRGAEKHMRAIAVREGALGSAGSCKTRHDGLSGRAGAPGRSFFKHRTSWLGTQRNVKAIQVKENGRRRDRRTGENETRGAVVDWGGKGR